MSMLGVPPVVEYKDVPADIYEVLTVDVEEVTNNFYDPEKDPKSKITQFKWKFIIREDGELRGVPLTYFTGSALGRNSRNKLTNLVKLLDPNFDIEKAYVDELDFRAANLHRPIRVTTTVVEKEKDGETKTYPKITGILPTKMGEPSKTELMELVLGGTITS